MQIGPRRIRKTKNSYVTRSTNSSPKPNATPLPRYGELPKPVLPKTENRKLLKGQKAIVTGASSGIGRSIALALGHAGADVCVNYVAGEDKAQAMVDELRGHGHTAMSFKADVSSEDDVARMFDAVREEFGTVDISDQQRRPAVGCAGRSDDPGAVEQSHRRQSDRPISLRARSDPRIQAPRRAAGNLVLRRQDHLHQLGPRSHPLGWSRELRGVERRRDVDDEKHRAGSRAAIAFA